jgi:hypothetical protein
MDLTFLEYGNVVSGTQADGRPYAIVGLDSLALNKGLLEHDLKQLTGKSVSLSEQQVKAAIAHDLGIDQDSVFFVEQVGDFHQDMGLVGWTPGTVLLNDAAAVARLQEPELIREVLDSTPDMPMKVDGHGQDVPKNPGDRALYQDARQIWQHARERIDETVASYRQKGDYAAKLADWLETGKRRIQDLRTHSSGLDAAEQVVEQQLNGSLTVIRVPGRFYKYYRVGERARIAEDANFINGEGGTGADGHRFFVSLGGRSDYQRAFLEGLDDARAGPVRNYFLDYKASQHSIKNMAGISCRTSQIAQHP